MSEQLLQVSQLSDSPSFLFSQLSDFAIMRAIVVFPTPQVPVKSKVCGTLLSSIEFRITLTPTSCPKISEKHDGLYLRDKTM